MGNVFRCYVEKKPGFAVEAEHLFGELRHTLGLTGLTGVRVLRRYDVEGVDAAVYAAARTTVLSEPQVDALWDEVMPAPEGEHTLLAVEALPGQYDQRADSCAQCIQMMHGGERPTVRAATVYVLEGALTTPEAAKARGYLINPVESREAALDKPATLRQDYPVPAAVPVLDGFTALDRAGLESVLWPWIWPISPSSRPTSGTRRAVIPPSPRCGWWTPTGRITAATPPSPPTWTPWRSPMTT